MNCHLIQGGDIQAIIGDASRDGMGGRQYCGVWSLTSRHRPFNAFGSSYAGLLPSELRGKSPRLEVLDDRTVALVRAATDDGGRYPSDCRATYRLLEPHTIDHELTFRDYADLCRRENVSRPYREVSWCSYMNCPDDPRLHLRSRGEWFRYFSPRHGVGSNIAPSYVPESELETLPPQNADRVPFHVDRIDRRFDEPFYHGRLGEMVLIFVFDTPVWLRFYCSPSGGGPSLLPGQTCPAWDFEWVIPESGYAVGREYRFRIRMIYKRFVSDDDVLDEYARARDAMGIRLPSCGE